MKETTEKGRAWLKREMRPYRPFVLFMAFLTVAGTLLSLAFAYLTQYIVNNAVEGNARLLLVFSAVLLAVLLARIAVQTSVKYFLERARAKINAGLRGKLFAQILRSDYAGLEKYHSGDLLNRLTTDVSAVASGTVSMLPALAGMAVQCVGAIAALLTLDALFTGIFVAGGLAAVHIGKSRAVDDGIGLVAAHKGQHLVPVGDVQLVHVHGQHAGGTQAVGDGPQLAFACTQLFLQLGAQLAAGAGDQDLHGIPSFPRSVGAGINSVSYPQPPVSGVRHTGFCRSARRFPAIFPG